MRYIRNIFIITIICLYLIIFTDNSVTAHEYSADSVENEPELYYFWGLCPICSKPEDHVGLFDNYKIKVEIYEVFYDQEGRDKYDQFRDSLGIEHFGFPTIVFKNQYWIGFSEINQEEIVNAIAVSLQGETFTKPQNVVRLPFIGDVDLVAAPILLTTAIIASLDGINPCSLFVLTFLLSIIIHSASRKRVVLVGLLFLVVTASVYGFFMLGILNIMLFANRLFWIRNLVAGLVVILGLIAIKDYMFVRKGFSFSIPQPYKSKYYQQVRNIYYTDALIPTILSTIVMAMGIALVELPCSAGLPFIWSSIVSEMNLPTTQFIILLAVYLLFYLFIELIIFFVAVLRMRSIKLTEEKGLFLKLVAGSLMFVLGLILFFKPAYMENVIGIALTFIAAGLLILLIFSVKKLVKR